MKIDLFKILTLVTLSISMQPVLAIEAEIKSNQHWVDLIDVSFRQEEMIVSSAHIGKGELATPAITLLEVKNGSIAVVMSQHSPSLFEREDDWNNQFRIVYLTKANERIHAKNYGESIGAPSSQWVSSLTFLPALHLLKKDTLKIIIQGLATPERLKAIEDIDNRREARDKVIDISNTVLMN